MNNTFMSYFLNVIVKCSNLYFNRVNCALCNLTHSKKILYAFFKFLQLNPIINVYNSK